MEFRARPDPLREGLANQRISHTPIHPVHTALTSGAQRVETEKDIMLASMYGAHFPIAKHLEKSIVSKPLRLGGLKNSYAAFDSLDGSDLQLTVGDWFGVGAQEIGRELPVGGVSESMEKQLGIGKKGE
eukprot:ANDGO_04996.mRNA.1 hypothetical protein